MVVRGRHLTLGCWLACLAVLTAGPPAASAASSQPGASCSNPTVSAVNQYCEDIPSATGPRTPGRGTHTLASSLPRQTVGQLAGSPGRGAGSPRSVAAGHGADQRLLSLPAPGPRVPLSSSAAAHPGDFALLRWLVLALAAATVGLAAVAIVRRHRGLTT